MREHRGGFPFWAIDNGKCCLRLKEVQSLCPKFGKSCPVEREIGDPGKAYTKWAAEVAVGLDTGVPWIMCKQDDAPDPVEEKVDIICKDKIQSSLLC
ncbi:hypothetical protein V6N12_067508 [Hibiscus sabdariffa]|uniref:Beta-galactosidase n=1 Tax=Hibiscus sabdariffa TaxID=183260 RepID=A0ABR2B830_9ROSI